MRARIILSVVLTLSFSVLFAQKTKLVIYQGINSEIRLKPSYNNLRMSAILDTMNTSYVNVTSLYSDPSWITSLAWSKITGTPTTLSGYGITDGGTVNVTSGQVAFGNGSSSVTSSNKFTWDNSSPKLTLWNSTNVNSLYIWMPNTTTASINTDNILSITAGTSINIDPPNNGFVVPYLNVTGAKRYTYVDPGGIFKSQAIPIPVADGGTGSVSPSLVAGTNVSITGTWPNQTIDVSSSGTFWNVTGTTTLTGNTTITGTTRDLSFDVKGFNVNENGDGTFIDSRAGGTFIQSETGGIFIQSKTGFTGGGIGIGRSANNAGGINIQDRNTISITGRNASGSSRFNFLIDGLTSDATTFTDNTASPKGIQLGGDYSATFVNESLITKRYADAAVSSATVGAALTKVDDTNVTLTLGGTPSTALLRASSLTLGWSGQLSPTRGGTGLSTYITGDLLYSSASNVLNKLAIGSTDNILKVSGGIPTWGSLNLASSSAVNGVLGSSNGGAGSISGILKANGSGTTSVAVAGTDYEGAGLDWRLTGTSSLTGNTVIANGSNTLQWTSAAVNTNGAIRFTTSFTGTANGQTGIFVDGTITGRSSAGGGNADIYSLFSANPTFVIGSGTNSQVFRLFDISGTFPSTTGGAEIFFANPTMNGSVTTSYLMHLQAAGADKFRIRYDGNMTVSGVSHSITGTTSNILSGPLTQVSTGGTNADFQVQNTTSAYTLRTRVTNASVATISDGTTDFFRFQSSNVTTPNGLKQAYVAKTANYTLTAVDYIVEVTSGTNTQTLPDATTTANANHIFAVTNSGTGVVTLGTTSSQTFANVPSTPTTLTLPQYTTYFVQSNGTNWILLSEANRAISSGSIPIATTNNRQVGWTDPNANTLVGWDDTDNANTNFTIGSGLTYTHSTHTLSATGGTIGGSTGSTDRAVVVANGTGGSTIQATPAFISSTADLTLGLSGTTGGSLRYLTADGSATDVGISLIPKGAGGVLVDLPSTSVFAVRNASLSTTNSPIYIIENQAQSTGTVTTGFGLEERNVIENAAGNLKEANIIDHVWTDATAGSEDSKMLLTTLQAGSVVSTAEFKGSAATFSGDVNLGFSGASSGSIRNILAAGSAANIDLLMSSKGNGSIFNTLLGTGFFDIQSNNTNTNQAFPMEIRTVRTSNTATVGFGYRQDWNIENASGSEIDASRIEHTWLDATNGSEDAKITYKVVINGTMTEVINFNGLGIDVKKPIGTMGYTVATLPAGRIGDTAYVTDALAPSFLVTVVGGGSVVAPVFYNGTNWVAH